MPPKPKAKTLAAFPEPAAVLPGEADILAAVVADLSDDTAKLVYADWLDERDNPRGELLRKCVAAFRAGKKLPGVKSAPEPWRDLVGITLMGGILAADLSAHADKILRLARPAIRFKSAKATDKKIPVGASKLGGVPDLPPDTEWPVFNDAPLTFLGQFDLAELAQSFVCRDLPESGLLSAFSVTDEEDDGKMGQRGSWRVFYVPAGSKLARAASDSEPAFRSCRLEFRETLTLPDEDSPWKKEIGLGRNDDVWWTYQEKVVGFDSGHRILGYPGQIQGDLLGKKTNRHLLTIGGDNNAGWEWGDGGSLYFTIAEADLKAGKFDKVRFEMQCG